MSGDDHRFEPPVNPIPLVPLVLALAFAAVEVVIQFGIGGFGGPTGFTWRTIATQDYAYAPAIHEQIFARGGYEVEWLKRLVTYPFVHASFTHAAFAVVLTLALGKYVGEVLRPLPFALLFAASTIGGALVYGALAPGNFGLTGAYPGIYGLIGAYTYLMWLTLGRLGENQMKAFTLIGILMGLTLVYSFLFGATPFWIAELAGFLIGLALAPLVAPGGWAAFLRRIRTR